MQELAETKKKKYCCVVWSKQSLNRSHLQYLAEISGATAGMNVDENGDRGLEVQSIIQYIYIYIYVANI